MKRTFLIVSLCMLAGFSFAQKKAVKDAKSAMKNNAAEARELIKPALTDPETANDPETWKVAGDIEYNVIEKELIKERDKEFSKDKKGWDEAVMAEALCNIYKPYLKADELGEIPDAKDKVKNKVRKNIAENLKTVHPYFINAGVHYNLKEDLVKASELFEIYWKLPKLDMFSKEKKDAFAPQDSAFQVIKFYSIITAIRSENTARASQLLEELTAEPYVANGAYTESDIYELLCNEYSKARDAAAEDDNLKTASTDKYIKGLNTGALKFPKNQYFSTNLINEYIKANKVDEALSYLDQALLNTPENTCDLKSVKASLFVDKKEYDTAIKYYEEAIAADAVCQRALEGLGVLYVVQAQDIRDEISKLPTNQQNKYDEKIKGLYTNAMPYFERLYNIQKENKVDVYVMRKTLQKLQNVYYNMTLLKTDKSKELDSVDAELKIVEDTIKQM